MKKRGESEAEGQESEFSFHKYWDVVGIYRKEGSSYIVQSALTGNALKVPGSALVVRLKGGPDWNDKLQSRLDRFR